ncbi:MAG TPA: hypothetical protein VM580_32115, partial [Labilithrix sp.]|nr:hypothetical protein [Labilithrix sp.]
MGVLVIEPLPKEYENEIRYRWHCVCSHHIGKPDGERSKLPARLPQLLRKRPVLPVRVFLRRIVWR